MLSHANLTAAARQLGTGLALTPRDRFLALAPLAHVMGFVVSLCAPLAAGATVVMLPRFELAALLDAIQRYRVTVIAVPPPVLAALARDQAVSRYDLSAVEALVSGGAPVSPELQAEVAGRFPGAMIGQARVLAELAAAGFGDTTAAQGRVFARIDPDGTRLTDLAERALITKQTAGFLVDQLERAGYVRRVPDPRDARARLVQIAERGQAAVEVARQTEAKVEAEWTAHLGEEATTHLRHALARLRDITDPYR
jgi:acyl-CoA synthetase (AMP-forming)/AMP-acid ligase II